MSHIPEPCDYCQYHEYDAEVLSFDEEHGIVWVLVYSGDPLDIRAITYRPDDWH